MINWRVSSMQARLTLLFGVIALAGSCVAGYTLFWALKQEVRHQEIAELSAKIELIAHVADMQDTPVDLHAMRRSLDTIFVGNENFKVWIRDSAGRLLYGNAPPNVIATLPGNEMVLRSDDGAQLRGVAQSIGRHGFTGR